MGAGVELLGSEAEVLVSADAKQARNSQAVD